MSEKHIVVIGASRGIGKAIVTQLAMNNSLHIHAFSRGLVKMQKAFEGLKNVTCYQLDLDAKDVREQMAGSIAGIAQIDVIINVAGYLVNKPFPELTREDLRKSYQVNVIGIMECVQALLPKIKKGHIVNISSMGGFQGSVKFPGLAAYSTSKAALCSFTELFAEEYKDTGVKMNCLCLGAVQTEMLEEAFPGYQASMGPAEMAEYIVDFSLNAHHWMNGKIIPVSLSTP